MSDRKLPETIRVTLLVVQLLEKLGLRYAIGGSVASAIHGVVRSTMDVDIVAELRLEHVTPFVEALEEDFYAEEGRIRDAVRRAGSFNLIHQETMFKVDVFVVKDQVFETSQIDRRVSVPISEATSERFFVTSPEDSVLAKLVWYRKGGELSDRQWRDVQGILRVQSDSLAREYMSQMASRPGILALLKCAQEEAASERS